MSITLKKPLIYVTRDIERALGMEPGRHGAADYIIVSNDTPYGRAVREKNPDHVVLIDRPAGTDVLDTFDLLSLPEVQRTIDKHDSDLIVFQNTPRIERLANDMHWNLLNPRAELSRQIEEKLSQLDWLGVDAALLPPHRRMLVKDVCFEENKFVLQFNHSHTGEGTYVIESKDALDMLAAKFPDRECRVVDFITGPAFTLNLVAGTLGTIHGSISYQITGIAPFTDILFSTVGNDWALPYSTFLSDKDRSQISAIAKKIGRRMRLAGWRGLFGIDVIKDEISGKIYLIEINARQPASTTYESILGRTQDPKRLTIFEAHVAALLKRVFPVLSARVRTGSQIVKRVTNKTYSINVPALRAKNLFVMEYQNETHNKELYRIQSDAGIMESHGRLNDLGNFISSCIQ